jgi:hypothetical protein
MSYRSLWRGMAIALAALGATACGSGSSSAGADNGVSAKSATQILASAEAAVKGAKSVHVSGSVVSSGQPITLDLHIASGRGGIGQMSENGLSFQIVDLAKTVYVKGSPAFWRHFGGDAAAQIFQNKWLKGPATGSLASFAALTNLPQLLGKILSTHGTLTKGATTTIAGQKVVAVDDAGQRGTLYVAVQGPPYPVQISKPGGDGGKLVFNQYDQPVTLTAPQGAIDLSQLQK